MRQNRDSKSRLSHSSLSHLSTILTRAQSHGISCITTDLRHLPPSQLAILASHDSTPDSGFPQALSAAIAGE